MNTLTKQHSYSALQIWVMAARPKTLFASLGLLIVSFSLSYHLTQRLEWSLALYTTLTTLLLQIASNLINDATDAKTGVDSAERLGPLRVTSSGLLTSKQITRGYQVCLALVFLLGIPLISAGGPVILAMGLISILMAYAYTAGPVPLSHYGLGELLAFLFFGPWAVMGAVYIQTQRFEFDAFLVGLLPGFCSAALMAVNNFRDREQDKVASKITLATLLSFQSARALPFLFVLLGALVVPFLLSWFNKQALYLLTSLSLIPFLPVYKELLQSQGGRHLNKVLGLTGAYLFFSCLCLSCVLIYLSMGL